MDQFLYHELKVITYNEEFTSPKKIQGYTPKVIGFVGFPYTKSRIPLPLPQH